MRGALPVVSALVMASVFGSVPAAVVCAQGAPAAPSSPSPAVIADARAVHAPAPAVGPKPADAELPASARPNITVTRAPTGDVAFGDRITVTLTVTARTGDEVSVPKDQSFAPFELLRTRMAPPAPAGDKTKQVFVLELLALGTGDIQIHPIRLRVVTKDGLVGFVSTSAMHLKVTSALANEPDAKPKPPTPPVVVMQDDYTLAYIGGALGLMALAALATFFVMRWWRKRAKPALPPPPPRPAWDVARERLLRLRHDQARAFEMGEAHAWVDGLSDTVREYLGRRFGFDGLERTTDEILAWLRSHNPRGVTTAEVATLLGECDLVKFAKMPPDPGVCEASLNTALGIVTRTTPADIATAASAGNVPPRAPQPGATS